MLVWDADSNTIIEVSRAEAAAGMVRYARSLGPGTPACGEYERRALEVLRGTDASNEEQATTERGDGNEKAVTE